MKIISILHITTYLYCFYLIALWIGVFCAHTIIFFFFKNVVIHQNWWILYENKLYLHGFFYQTPSLFNLFGVANNLLFAWNWFCSITTASVCEKSVNILLNNGVFNRNKEKIEQIHKYRILLKTKRFSINNPCDERFNLHIFRYTRKFFAFHVMRLFLPLLLRKEKKRGYACVYMVQ